MTFQAIGGEQIAIVLLPLSSRVEIDHVTYLLNKSTLNVDEAFKK